MALFYLLAFVILFYGAKYQKQGYYSDNLGMDQSNAIKGLFILMVFISHSMLEVRDAGFGFVGEIDALGFRIRSEFGQLIVVMFLFYSGYGVMESYANKGRDYLKTFPKKRLLTTLLNFDIAVLLFAVLDLALGIEIGLKQFGLSLLGWREIGNSNWYIFVILFCYAVAYMGFRVFPNNKVKSAWMISIAVFMGMLALPVKKQSWWYDTMLCFPTGVWFSIYKDKFTDFFKRRYLVVLLVALAAFLVLHFVKLPGLRGITHNVKSISFAVVVVLLTMKIKTGNVVLQWLGINLFPIFIYQRIPMIAISKLAGDGFVSNNPYVFMIVCFAVTCLITWGYRFWQVRL